MIEDFFEKCDYEEKILQENRNKEYNKSYKNIKYNSNNSIKVINDNKTNKRNKEIIELRNYKFNKIPEIIKRCKVYFYNYFYNDGLYLKNTCDKNKEIKSNKIIKVKDKNYSCAHCNAVNTPLWRHLEKDKLCNACWLYYKSHGTKRPNKLKSKGIVRRQKRKSKVKN